MFWSAITRECPERSIKPRKSTTVAGLPTIEVAEILLWQMLYHRKIMGSICTWVPVVRCLDFFGIAKVTIFQIPLFKTGDVKKRIVVVLLGDDL